MLNWRTITGERNPKFFVKGTELAVALYANNRFAIYEIRTITDDGPDRRCVVRDAATVTDADTAAGKRPAIVWQGDTTNEAIKWCDAQP